MCILVDIHVIILPEASHLRYHSLWYVQGKLTLLLTERSNYFDAVSRRENLYANDGERKTVSFEKCMISEIEREACNEKKKKKKKRNASN